jgi:hypothetical protein
MPTIHNTINTGSNAGASVRTKIAETQQQLRDLDRNAALSSDEIAKKRSEYNDTLSALTDELSAARDTNIANISNNATMFGLSSGSSAVGTVNATAGGGLNVLFGAGATLSNLQAINLARVGIENRSRSLVSEIKMDKMRGINTSAKEEALANLTENLSILDSSLSSDVDATLSGDSEDTYTLKPGDKTVIQRIRDQLDANQKKLDAEFDEETTAADTTDETTETGTDTSTETTTT